MTEVQGIQAIIGLSGKFCSGKTTVADMLVGLDGRYTVTGFARALKKDVEAWTGVKITDANKAIFRPLLQAYGTAMFGLFAEDYWVKRLLVNFGTRSEPSYLIIEDVRYPHEVEALRAFGAANHLPVFIARIDIDPVTQEIRHRAKYGCPPDPALLLHASETALDTFSAFEFRVDGTYPLPLLRSAFIHALAMSGMPFTGGRVQHVMMPAEEVVSE